VCTQILQGCQDPPWFALLLPYVDQGQMSDAFNYDHGAVGNPSTPIPPYPLPGMSVNETIMTRWIQSFLCPSDDRKIFRVNPVYNVALSTIQLTRGNYAAAWGNTNWGQESVVATNGLDGSFQKSAFGQTNTRLREFNDGLSKTVVMAEVIQATDIDLRGFFWMPLPGGGMITSRFTPNGYTDFYQVDAASSTGDAMPNAPGVFCVSEAPALRCYSINSDRASFAGARSRHVGGVNALKGDGSAVFVSDAVDGFLWTAAQSVAGEEAVPSL
ncbi:MAG: DUF1559 domain-containing protein, partial [Planctomycetia bacterium]